MASEKSTPTARSTPMKVLCLGFGRTGTISLRESLRMLGYRNPYHTMDAHTGRYDDFQLWRDMLKAKAAGKKVTREDFDRILGDSQAVLDMPGAYFVDELLEAYPDAKVILTVRDTESWYASVKKTLRPLQDSFLMPILLVTGQLLFMPTRWMFPMHWELEKVLYDHDFESNGRRMYERHNAYVQSVVPAERLLVRRPGDGWEPLCKFLGRELPDDTTAEERRAAPHLNHSALFNEKFAALHLRFLMLQAKRVLDVSAYAVLTATVVGAVARRWPFKWFR